MRTRDAGPLPPLLLVVTVYDRVHSPGIPIVQGNGRLESNNKNNNYGFHRLQILHRLHRLLRLYKLHILHRLLRLHILHRLHRLHILQKL